MGLLGLREFLRMRGDPRLLIVDAREGRPARFMPLDNPFFAWIRIVESPQIDHLARDISQRHLIIVHEDEERALDLDHVFATLEINSAALEGGERGWQEAVIGESTEMRGDALVVTMNQLAFNRRHYLIIHDGHAVSIQPFGSIAAIREEARHQSARIDTVVDIASEASVGERLADVVHASYYRANSLEEAWSIGLPLLK